MGERRIYDLPIFIEDINIESSRDIDKYTLENAGDIEAIKKFYTDKGIEIVDVEHIDPAIGPERDEINAYFPEGWNIISAGGPWVDVIDKNKNVKFSMFVKKAPWDYCFFTRPKLA